MQSGQFICCCLLLTVKFAVASACFSICGSQTVQSLFVCLLPSVSTQITVTMPRSVSKRTRSRHRQPSLKAVAAAAERAAANDEEYEDASDI